MALGMKGGVHGHEGEGSMGMKGEVHGYEGGSMGMKGGVGAYWDPTLSCNVVCLLRDVAKGMKKCTMML